LHDGDPARRPDSERPMTVGGFASLREFIRRAVRQLDGVPNDVLTTLENQVRLYHELLLDAWDEMRDRGTAVSHVTDREYKRARQLVNDVLQAAGEEVATLWRDQDPVARALIEMIAQEVAAYHEEPR
jgi:hypothetical protein